MCQVTCIRVDFFVLDIFVQFIQFFAIARKEKRKKKEKRKGKKRERK